ncbi:MAG: amidohydrolase [Actinobacteria bacterium]|nr:amidohydrolase [Actinomycetota bacterium]
MAERGAADLVLTNASVLTMDPERPRATAVAVRDGEIVLAGDAAEAKDLTGPATELIDAGGRTLMPGIHDGHVHALDGGRLLSAANLRGERLDLDGFLDALADMLERDGSGDPDAWLNVYGWEPLSMARSPTRDDLDRLPTKRPILVNDGSAHTSVANSRALELSAVGASAPDPEGGRLGRREDGEPDGVLWDEAIVLVSKQIPAASGEENRRALRAAHELMARRGITSYLDVWTRGPDLEAHSMLHDSGEMLVRPAISLAVTPESAPETEEMLAGLDRLRAEHGRPGIGARTAKMFLDGVIEHPAHTAAMLEPYLDESGTPTADRGPTYFSQELTDRTVAALDAAGWQVHMHAIGDRAVRSGLDAVQSARERNGPGDRRHTIAHVQLVDPADFGRFAQLEVLPSIQAQWARWDLYTVEALRPYMGDERWRNTYPFARLQRAGARLCGGSDWPVDDELRPFHQIATAVTRTASEDLPAQPQPLFAEEAITMEESLVAHTAGSAFQMHQEGSSGTLREGMRADLIVLDRDPLGFPPDQVHGTEVLLTAVGGEVVHRSEELN